MATESFEIINDTLSWPTRLSRTRISSVQGLGLSDIPSLDRLNLDDILRTVQRLELKRCLYSDIESLGQVGEGETFRVDKCIFDKQVVAVKHIKLDATQPNDHRLDKRLRAVRSEIQIMYHAPLREHPNILSILGYGWRQSGQAPMPYVVVEYAVFGSLRQYLVESERSLRTKIIMAGDIAAGLNALHQCEIVHGDMKLDNVVVLESWDRPPGVIAKLCDFGHAIVLSGYKKNQKYYGTALYNAPEVECQDLSPIDPADLPKCDMWAYGLALWEIFKNGEVFFKKNWRDDVTYEKVSVKSLYSKEDGMPDGSFASLSPEESVPQSEESARTLFGRFDPRHLAKLAIDLLSGIKFGGGFVDKAILRKFLDRALRVDPRDRPSKITLGPLMSTWNPADINTLRAKLSIHTGSAGWSFNLLRPDQGKEIMWEHQLQILQDFETISKRHKSPDDAAAGAFQVAMCYLSGFGTSKDVRISTRFMQEAEERDHPAAKLFSYAFLPETSASTHLNYSAIYQERIINGLKTIHSIDKTTSLVVQWRNLDSKPLDLSQEASLEGIPPKYEELLGGTVIEYSTITKSFSYYADFRAWVIDCVRDGTDPFLLTPETSVTTVPTSSKANLLETAIIFKDKMLIGLLCKHITVSCPGYLGDHPLVTACRTGSTDILQTCLGGQSDPFPEQPDGSTFLHWMFMLESDVRYILGSPEFLQNIKRKNVLDNACVATKVIHHQWPLQLIGSPLAFSVAAYSFTGIAALLRLGANPLASIYNLNHDANKDWWTPIHLAVKYHSPELLVLLLLGLPKHEFDLSTRILASVKARLAKFPFLVEILGGAKSPLAKALTKPKATISFTNLWNATFGCALSYSTTAERIAIHGINREQRLAELIALLPSSCFCLSTTTGKTPLMQAIDFNDLCVVTAMLRKFPQLASKAFLDPLNGQFTYPIHFASQIAGRRDADDALEILTILLQCEANQMLLRDSKGKTPLHYSVTGTSDRATKWLMEKGCSVNATDDQGQSALHTAQSSRNIVALLDAGSSIDQQDKHGRAAIHVAVSPGSEDLVKTLITRGASLSLKDKFGHTALHQAVVKRSRDVCAILLDAQVDVNIQACNGDTPLHLSIQSSRSDILKLLIEKGADISITSAGLVTPLHQCVILGDFNCFNRTLASVQRQNPALVNAIDQKQQTSLHMAARFARVGMAEKLLQHGADVDAIDEDGNTAFHLAVESDPSLGHTQANKIDFLALLYTHWTSNYKSDINKTDVINAKLNTENLAGKSAWDLAYQQRAFVMMDFLITRGGFDICRQLQIAGEYIGNKLLNCAIDSEEWDFVISLLQHETILDMHPILKDAPAEDLYLALRMNDKRNLKAYLKGRMCGEDELCTSGLHWLDGRVAESELFRPWEQGKDGESKLSDGAVIKSSEK